MGIFASSDASSKAVGNMGRLKEDKKLYRLVDMHGGGDLIQWMRYAERSNDHSIVDSYIDIKVREFMYNHGRGKLVTITELVKLRNKERNAMLGAFSRKKGKGKSGPNVLDEFDQEGENVGDLKKALKLLDGGGKGGKNEKYREIAWKLDERGSMGETLVGVCILNGSAVHINLVYKLISMFPKLVNDINISEDYYGLSPMHQAIVNQDLRLVAILLKNKADVHQRCYGAYFCADDQKTTRTDSLEHEHVDVHVDRTNYTGKMYFGEYPLSFAACLNHPDCYRLLVAYKANQNAQDSNGNTALHMCVIHEKIEILRLAIEMGAKVGIVNRQNLTPLTLAAKLGKKQMFMELMEYECEIIWDYGESMQCSYALNRVDTINEDNGDLDDTSALSLAVYGMTNEHLNLLDGILDGILQAKWDTFAKAEWMKSLLFFFLYFLLFFSSFMNRPFSKTTELETHGAINEYGQVNTDYLTDMEYEDAISRCHLSYYAQETIQNGWFRLGCEASVVIMIFIQIFWDIADIRRIGRTKWINIYKEFPAKVIFKISWILVLLIIPMRLLCTFDRRFLLADNHLSSFSVVLTTVHFLFYCRAIKFIGPFVLMIYTIIATDLKRFILIYLVFLMGFSQAFYIIFYSCEASVKFEAAQTGKNVTWENIMSSPQESIIRTFIMTIGEFMVFYRKMDECPQMSTSRLGKMVFLVFELCVSILQLNLLIAMMTRTYENISKTKEEYKRQWAQVILMLEVSLPPQKRLKYLYKYSHPTGTVKERRSFIVKKRVDSANITEYEKERIMTKEQEVIEERKMLQKRKKMDMDIEKGIRPTTSYNVFKLKKH